MSSYDKKQTLILNPDEGYNKAYKQYKKYHNFLETFDKNLWQKFLPRDLKGKIIVDLGCGDGRISKFFVGKQIKEYIGIDISEKMLDQTKSYVKKINHNLNKKPWPIKDEYADIVISLFVLIHIEDINLFFQEIYRILKSGGKFILFHHIERKPVKYKIENKEFKIKTFPWPYRKIEDLLDYNFFSFKTFEVEENGIIIGKYFICEK